MIMFGSFLPSVLGWFGNHQSLLGSRSRHCHGINYYASCMDEPAIEKLGAKPLLPELDRIAALRSKQDLAEYAATTQFPPSLYGGGTLITFRSNQDFKDSTQVIAEADQGGLGLPDRDYYLKDDAK